MHFTYVLLKIAVAGEQVREDEIVSFIFQVPSIYFGYEAILILGVSDVHVFCIQYQLLVCTCWNDYSFPQKQQNIPLYCCKRLLKQ